MHLSSLVFTFMIVQSHKISSTVEQKLKQDHKENNQTYSNLPWENPHGGKSLKPSSLFHREIIQFNRDTSSSLGRHKIKLTCNIALVTPGQISYKKPFRQLRSICPKFQHLAQRFGLLRVLTFCPEIDLTQSSIFLREWDSVCLRAIIVC